MVGYNVQDTYWSENVTDDVDVDSIVTHHQKYYQLYVNMYYFEIYLLTVNQLMLNISINQGTLSTVIWLW